MSYRVPQNGKLSQPNMGDTSGNLYKSQNLDLKTNPGKLKVSSRLTVAVKDDDSGITDMGVPSAIVTHTKTSTKQYYIACGVGSGSTNGSGRILVSDSALITDDYDVDPTSNTPTNLHADYTDMITWSDGNYAAGNMGQSILVSTYSSSTSQIKKLFNAWNTTWFTSSVSGTFKVQGLKNMCNGFNGNLYITDDDCIHYVPYSSTQTASNAVLAFNTGSGVGTGTAGTLYFAGKYRPIWIRSSSNKLWIGLMTYDAGVGSKGYVAEWDATGTSPNKIYDLNAPCALSCVIEDDVPVIIDAYGRLKKFNGARFVEIARLPVANLNIEMPGIYNDSTNSRWIHHRGMDIVDGKININVNNFVSTGVYVEEMPSGIWEYDESVGLYHKSSPCSASTDWGQKQILTAGAIYGSKRSTATLLAGYAYYTDNATTSRNGLFYDDIATNTNKRALITLPFINSSEMDDSWQKVAYRFRPFPSGDKVLGKFRSAKDSTLPLLISITWTGTTTFTTTTNILAYHPNTLNYNPEIEVVMGKASGTTAHITNIDASNATGSFIYTVTLDDAISDGSGSGKAYLTNFKKMSATGLTDQNTDEGSMNIAESKTKVQVKTELRATGSFELDDITIINKNHKPIA
jgi:hypothetical protein